MSGMLKVNEGANQRPQKDERIAVRLTSVAKHQLELAAEISGRNVSDFVVSSALKEARRTIEDSERMRLTDRDRAVFMDALSNPPAPNEALKSAAARYLKTFK